jgi:cell division protein FtsW
MTLWLVALAAGLPYLQLGATAMGGMLLAVLSISFREYQRRRIMSFLNPWADPMQDGYQLIQSLLAVGSGGIWGVGLGMSQQKLFYLPIQYSDFIFAVFAEEFGLVGGFSLLLMLAAYGTVALRVATRARNLESQLVAIGVMVVMVGQSLLNIGVATGVLPTTGLPLPFFSYGGSSMLASLLLSGLLIRVARESSEADVVSLDRLRGKPGKPSLRSNNGNTQVE